MGHGRERELYRRAVEEAEGRRGDRELLRKQRTIERIEGRRGNREL